MRDSGMVTAELALAVPALTAAVLALAWVLGLGGSHLALAQATREGARAAARGESAAHVRSVVQELVPGATVLVRRSAGRVVVTSVVRRTPPVGFLRPLARDVRATATTWWEGT